MIAENLPATEARRCTCAFVGWITVGCPLHWHERGNALPEEGK